VLNLKNMDIDGEVIRAVPASIARMYNIVPVQTGPNAVTLATYDHAQPRGGG
jgi:hypothetical protein